MAVQDPAQQNPHVQRLIDAAQVGATVQAGKAAVVAPAVAPTIIPAVAAKAVAAPVELRFDVWKVQLLLRALARTFRRSHLETASWLERDLRKRYPNVDIGVIRAAVEREMAYERAFQAKALKRVEADANLAMQLPTKEAQAARMKAIMRREQHYTGLRQRALMARATGACEAAMVKMASPLWCALDAGAGEGAHARLRGSCRDWRASVERAGHDCAAGPAHGLQVLARPTFPWRHDP